MRFLCLCASKIISQSYCYLWIFTIRINTNCFRTSERFQLFLFTVDCNCRKLCYTIIVTKSFFYCCCIPGTRNNCIYRTITQSGKSCTSIIKYKIRICNHIYQIIGNLCSLITREINTCRLICSIFTKQSTSVCYIERSHIPRICKFEGNFPFFKHRIQILNIILGKY